MLRDILFSMTRHCYPAITLSVPRRYLTCDVMTAGVSGVSLGHARVSSDCSTASPRPSVGQC
jgi:hypothetical protein